MNSVMPYRNLWGLTFGVAFGLAVVAVRLVYIQAINPQEPTPFSSNDTEIRRLRPARRGEIRDANDNILVHSQLAVVVRADPARIGDFAPEIAKLAAQHLELPESEVLARLQPVHTAVTQWVTLTNGGVVVTNRQVTSRLRRSNVIATNVAPIVWDHLFAALQTNQFQVQNRLIDEKHRILTQFKAGKAGAWWDLRTLWRANKERSEALRANARSMRSVQTNLLECRASGLFPEYVELRRYPHDELAAHVLGFTTNDLAATLPSPNLPPRLKGAQGIESRFDQALQGRVGEFRGQVVRGREYVPLRDRDIPAENGLTVCLTLDVQIQEAVERALDEAVARLNPLAISAIVIRPQTGDVLALANRPTFNPNDRRLRLTPGLSDPLSAFKNRAINEPFEPGSTFKIVTYAAVLNEQLATLNDWIDCNGGRWQVPGTRRWIRDDQGHYMNKVTLEEAFAKSSNVGAVQLGLRMATNKFVQYIRDFGFLARTDIECGEQFDRLRVSYNVISPGVTNAMTNLVTRFGEEGGAIPSWDGLTSSSLPFGYGLRATPLQMVMAAAAIANGGVLMKPRLVRAIKTEDGRVVKDFPVQSGRRVVKPETADQMVSLMEAVVTKGTGGQAALEDFEVAGKTGTAKKYTKAGYTDAHYYGSFVGFFPAHNPVAAIIITVDEPTTAGKSYYGGKAAAPVFREIALDIANAMKLTPTVVRTNSAAAKIERTRTTQIAKDP